MCVIKEEDLLLCMDKVNSVPVPKFPVRVVMNNKTISVFTTDVLFFKIKRITKRLSIHLILINSNTSQKQ
jgi:hypothetical protein